MRLPVHLAGALLQQARDAMPESEPWGAVEEEPRIPRRKDNHMHAYSTATCRHCRTPRKRDGAQPYICMNCATEQRQPFMPEPTAGVPSRYPLAPHRRGLSNTSRGDDGPP